MKCFKIVICCDKKNIGQSNDIFSYKDAALKKLKLLLFCLYQVD